MILVLLGTQNNSFHRLLEKMDELINKGIINEKVIVQSGYTNYESKNMRVFDLIPQEELERYQEQADLIITHGGVGSIISSIKKGKKVIAVPRLHEYHEHVNDHQKQIVELSGQKGYLIGISGVNELEEAIIKAQEFKPVKYEKKEDGNKKMLSIIQDFIEKILSSKNQKLLQMWKFFTNMKEYKLFKKEPKTSKYYVYSKTKKRYIDPLVQTIDGVKRVSQIDSDFKKTIENHIGASDKWIVVDYERNEM